MKLTNSLGVFFGIWPVKPGKNSGGRRMGGTKCAAVFIVLVIEIELSLLMPLSAGGRFHYGVSNPENHAQT